MKLPCRACTLLLTKLLLCLLLCWPGMWSSELVNAKQQDTSPIALARLIESLKHEALTKEEWLELVTLRGVRSLPTRIEENNIRLAGRNLGKQALDELLTVLRANYLAAPVNETLTLLPDAPARVANLGFQATYIKQADGGNLLKVVYPGAEKFEPNARTGCEYNYNWGNRDFTLNIVSASPQEIRVVLARAAAPAVPLPGRNIPATDYPATRKEHLSACVPITLVLVIGNHIPSHSLPMASYYISEPLPIGVLRDYAGALPLKTPIPPGAKDTDPIKAIYYQDAVSIAKMLGARLPSLEQWVNAFHAGALKLTPRPELVDSKGGRWTKVQLNDNTSPTSTLPSSPIATFVQPDDKSLEPTQGLLRIICWVGDKCPIRSSVIIRVKKPTNQIVP